MLKADSHPLGLYLYIWLLHAFPRITESLKTKSPLDQKLLVIVHHRPWFKLSSQAVADYRLTSLRQLIPIAVANRCTRY